MASNGLPKTAVSAEMAKKHDKNVIRTEKREAYRSAELAAKNDPAAQKWLREHRYLWR